MRKRQNREKKEIEYEEAPSGNVTFYNYKEPLMKFEQGHGFIGALVFDTESDKIQCHLCGEWFGHLPSHLAKEHNMRSAAYKDLVGLNQTTALINESMRAKMIASGLKKRMKNLRNNTPIPIVGYKKNKGRDRIEYDFQLANGGWYRWTVPIMQSIMAVDTAMFDRMEYEIKVMENFAPKTLASVEVPKPKPKKKTNFQLSLKKLFWNYYIRHGKFPMSFINP